MKLNIIRIGFVTCLALGLAASALPTAPASLTSTCLLYTSDAADE